MTNDESGENFEGRVTTDFELSTITPELLDITYHSPSFITTHIPESRLDIEMNGTFLENQEERIIAELGLTSEDAKIISNAVGKLVEQKIKEKKKQWSETVIKSFTNLIIGILIEETKELTPVSIVSQEDSYAINEVMIA